MKKKLLILVACGLIKISSYAQVALYPFTQATATYSEITGGTVLGDATTDEQRFVDPAVPLGSTDTSGVGLPIGFNFTYNAKVYDRFAIDANGWISLGQSSQTPAVNIKSSSYLSPIGATSTAPASLQDRIAGFARNLIAQTNSELRYQTIGTTPNQTLVVQWKNYKRSGTGITDTLNFQIKLYETLNKVEVVFGQVKVSSNSTTQVGLRGDANTDFNTRTTTTNWSASTAGTANSTMTLSTTVVPVSGLTYIFSYPSPNDAGITLMNSPALSLVNGSQKIAVTIKNFGSDTLKSASIAWSVNNVAQISKPWAGKIATNATNGPDTIGTYNFTTPGLYTIKAWTESPNGSTDGNHSNDTAVKIVYVKGYASLPFAENFDKTWITSSSEVPSISWVNTPATGNSSWRRDDNGASAGWTSATGGYTPTGAGTTLHSARFHSRSATNGSTGTMDAYLDFSSAGSKALKFWHINTSGTDTLAIYLSSDGGSTYSLIQKIANSAVWMPYFVSLGNSTSANTIVRFSVTNLTSGNGQTDVGIDSVQTYLLPANDAGLTVINAPNTPVIQGSNSVTVTLKNYGAANLTSASIGWSVNAVTQTAYSYTNPGLVTGATDGPVAIGNYNFTPPGFYTIKAWTSSPNGSTDADHTNDTVSKIVYVQGFASIPFLETFDNTWINKNATKDVPTDFWTNTPATGDNSWRRYDDSLSAPWTNSTGGQNGDYTTAGANGTAYSARFHTWDSPKNSNGNMDLFVNLSSKSGNKILDFWYINPSGNDSLSVYLSTDAGANFSLVQKFMNSSSWKRYFINIGNSTSANCVVRFKTTSDYGQDDIGIDQVQIYKQPSNDMTAVEWVSPAMSCGLTNAETVVIKVTNTGANSQSNIPVKYSINGGTTIVTESMPGPVAPGPTATYSFTAKANFSNPGIYPCGFVVSLSNDSILSNDTAGIMLTSISDISNIPYTDSLEMGNLHYALSYAANAMATYSSTVGNNGTYGFNLTGGGAGTWPSGTSANTTAQQAFSYTDHIAALSTCQVNASSITGGLYLRFDLKQTYSSGNGPKYSYFMVMAGTDTLSDTSGVKFFNPDTANSASFATKVFDLSAYAGKNFSISFMSACKYNDANSAGIGDHAYVDNIAIYSLTNGIHEYTNNAFIAVSPNPSGGVVSIALSAGFTGKSEISVCSLEGQNVYIQKATNNSTRLDLSDLPKGVYFIKVTNEKGYAVKKLILQ